MRFRDRADAGGQLAWRLQQYRVEAPIVVGLARDGVPVAAEVARALGAPLDVLVVRQLPCPWQPEQAIGALGEDDAHYRRSRPLQPVRGRTVILVDDGLTTGASARAAIRVAVGQSYENLTQTSDEDVTRLLATLWAAPPVPDVATAEDDPERACVIELGPVQLPGDLAVPLHPVGMVVFAHGAASGRHTPRNRLVARTLNQSRLATLLVDLLTPAEESDRAKFLDIGLLAGRLTGTTRWLQTQPETHGLPVGFFGAGIGAAAALWAAADLGDQVRAVVSRGGRPDLAGPRLAEVRARTLLLVGERDELVLERNRQAQAQLGGPSALEIIGGASHLFEEPRALDRVAALAAAWFRYHLPHPDPASRTQEPTTGRRQATGPLLP